MVPTLGFHQVLVSLYTFTAFSVSGGESHCFWTFTYWSELLKFFWSSTI